jgi:hypothetical protein
MTPNQISLAEAYDMLIEGKLDFKDRERLREIDHCLWRLFYFDKNTHLQVSVDDPKDHSLVPRSIKVVKEGVWRWEDVGHPFKEGEWVFDATDGKHYACYVYVTPISTSLDAALNFVQFIGWSPLHFLDDAQHSLEMRGFYEERNMGAQLAKSILIEMIKQA